MSGKGNSMPPCQTIPKEGITFISPRPRRVSSMNKRASNIAKGLAIIMMIWHHAFYSIEAIVERVGEQETQALLYSPLGSNMVFTLAKTFKLCVPIFVFITGYGTYCSLMRRKEGCASPSSNKLDLVCYSLGHHVGLILKLLPILVLGIIACNVTGTRTLRSVYGGKGHLAAGFYFLIDALGLARVLDTPSFNATWWYLSFAVLLIYLVPLLIALSERFDSLPLLAICCIAPSFLDMQMSAAFNRYLPAAILGIFCAQHQVFGAASGHAKQQPLRTVGLMACLITALIFLLIVWNVVGYVWLFHSIGACLVCAIAIYVERIGGHVLAFLGKHSANMFMCHTFFLSVLLPKQIYSLQHWWLVLLAIILISLTASVLVEAIKEVSGYNGWCNRCVSWAQNRLMCTRE